MADWTEARWHEVLTAFNDAMLAHPDQVDAAIDEAVIASGWMGFPPASEQDIAEAEARLSVVLPPSLRTFYAVSNGWRNVGWHVNQVPSVQELRSFKDALPVTYDVLLEGVVGRGETVDELDDDEDDARMFRSIPVTADNDNSIWLLDPHAMGVPAGECQVMDLQVDYFGMDWYASFGALFEHALHRFQRKVGITPLRS